jgi:hypothetical protein
MKMKIEEFEQERTILNQLMEERMNEPENDRYIIYDGVMKPDLYFNNKIRLAWMLKEPYDEEDGSGGGWNYFDMFPEGQNLYEVQFKRGHKTTWHPMIYISYSIFNNFQKWEEMEYIRDKNEMCDVVRQVAFINSQKLPSKGFTNTNFEHLWESIAKNSDLLKKQIELLNPNVFIFGNTIGLYKSILNLNLGKLQNFGSCEYIILEDKLFISAYHPSQRKITRETYVNDIVNCVKIWQTQKQNTI